MTEQARRTYQNIVAALEQETQQEAVQDDSRESEGLTNQRSQSVGVELSNSEDNKLTANDVT